MNTSQELLVVDVKYFLHAHLPLPSPEIWHFSADPIAGGAEKEEKSLASERALLGNTGEKMNFSKLKCSR